MQTINIYDAHRKAFTNVSAWVILDAQDRTVATVAVKYGARVAAFTHYIGVTMTRGSAGGGGYDRQSAAVQDGFAKAIAHNPKAIREDWQKDANWVKFERETQSALDAFRQALNSHDGSHWYQNLERAGYHVLQAI